MSIIVNIESFEEIVVVSYVLSDANESRFAAAVWLSGPDAQLTLSWGINDSESSSRLELSVRDGNVSAASPVRCTKFANISIERIEIQQADVFTDSGINFTELEGLQIILKDGRELAFAPSDEFYGALMWQLNAPT